jgi:hypothetical protein
MTVFLSDVRSGWAATRLLVALRWRMVRSRSTRVAILVAGFLLLLSLVALVNAGYALEIVAQQRTTVAGLFARYWAASLAYGNTYNVGAVAVGGAVVSALFAPFTGSGTTSLASVEDMGGLRPNRVHRYFDALIVNTISGLGLLQLMMLTAVCSMLCIDGQLLPGLVFGWSVWLFLVIFMTTNSWFMEWAKRRYTRRTRVTVGLSISALLGVAAFLDAHHGTTLFGLADMFTRVVRSGLNGWTPALGLVTAGMVLAAAGMLLAGAAVTRAALRHAEEVTKHARQHRMRSFSAKPFVVNVQLLTRVLWRTKEIRRPLVLLAAAGIPAMLFMAFDRNVEFSLIAALPLTVAVGWAVNTYGVIGDGMLWLASRPALLKRLPVAAFVLQFVLSVFVPMVLWSISLAAGHATLSNGATLIQGLLLAASGITSHSVYLAICRPHRARLSGRGDALLPPLVALGYLFRLLVLGPLPAIVFLAFDGSIVKPIAAIIVFLVCLLSLLRAAKVWHDRERMARLVAVTSAA